jgi:hypothetical protein
MCSFLQWFLSYLGNCKSFLGLAMLNYKICQRRFHYGLRKGLITSLQKSGVRILCFGIRLSGFGRHKGSNREDITASTTAMILLCR